MPRVPTKDDFAVLAPDVEVALVYPDPPASTTAILVLLHGLGDAESSFAAFARALRLPGVLAIAVRGTSILPSLLVDDDALGQGPQHFYWADDLSLHDGDVHTFDRARQLVGQRLVQDVLVQRCGWLTNDVLLFGFGQGGELALALAGSVNTSSANGHYKGVVTVGVDTLPQAITMTSPSTSTSSSPKKTPLLVCGPAEGPSTSNDTISTLRQRFEHVDVAAWTGRRPDDNGMPRNRAEMQPVMAFLAARLRAW